MLAISSWPSTALLGLSLNIHFSPPCGAEKIYKIYKDYIMKMFFSISYSFIKWMFKAHKDTHVFNMTDDEFSNYRFKVTVERIKENA